MAASSRAASMGTAQYLVGLSVDSSIIPFSEKSVQCLIDIRASYAYHFNKPTGSFSAAVEQREIEPRFHFVDAKSSQPFYYRLLHDRVVLSEWFYTYGHDAARAKTKADTLRGFRRLFWANRLFELRDFLYIL